MVTRCVIYSRCSTQMQADDELSIPAQVAECRKFAASKDWQVVGEYADAGFSGRTDERPQFQRMIDDAKRRAFDVILTWRSNRLFRNVEHRLAYSRILRRHGVRFVSLHEPEFEGASAQFMETVLTAADEMYAKQVAEDTLRGLKQIAGAGFSAGGRAPIGYRNVKKVVGVKPNGEPVMRTAFEPDPEKAPVVRRVFEMYASGKTGPQIIMETGIVSARNNLSTMLRNRAYIGERVYYSTRRADKKSIRLKNADADVIRVKDAHDAIVPAELFEKVQFMLRKKRPREGALHASDNNYLLSGILWCREHDEPYTGNSNGDRLYYSCARRKRVSKAAAPCALLRKEPVEKAVINALKHHVINRPMIRSGLEALRRERILAGREDTSELLKLKAELKQIDLELSRFHQAIASGVNADAVQEPINDRQKRRKNVQADIVVMERQKSREQLIDPVSDEEVEIVVDQLNRLFDQPTQELKVSLMRFLEKVEVDAAGLRMHYTFRKPTKVWTKNGDPDGIRTHDLHRDRVAC